MSMIYRHFHSLALAQGAPVTPADPAAAGFDWQAIGTELSRLTAEYGFRVAGALVFLVVAWIVSAYIVRAMVKGLTAAHVDITLAKFLANVARWVMLVLVVVACLGIFGVPATSFVTVLGTVGLAIGLAVQGSLSHLAAGIMLMIFRPFRVGDSVVVAGQAGVVDEIELFSTRLDTGDNRRVIIPNGQIFGAIIVNVTYHSQRKIDIPIGVGYSADIEETRRVLLNAAGGTKNLAAGRPVGVTLVNFSASSVDWMVSVWAEGMHLGDVKQEAMQRIKEGLDAAGIDIPFPQMVVHTPSLVRETEKAGA
jgi:small conductance mechanosensitive channel